VIGIVYFGTIGLAVWIFTKLLSPMTREQGTKGAVKAFFIAYAVLVVVHGLALLRLVGNHPNCWPTDTISSALTFLIFQPHCEMNMAIMEPFEPLLVVACRMSLIVFALLAVLTSIRAQQNS